MQKPQTKDRFEYIKKLVKTFLEELAKSAGGCFLPFAAISVVAVILVLLGFRISTEKGVEISILGTKFTLVRPAEPPVSTSEPPEDIGGGALGGDAVDTPTVKPTETFTPTSIATPGTTPKSSPTSRTLDGSLIDFETPNLGEDDSRVIDPYVDSITGVIFTAVPTERHNGLVGLVKNSETSVCVEPADSNQKLGTVTDKGTDSNGIGRSGYAIKATFPTPLSPLALVSVDVQTGVDNLANLALFDSAGQEITSTTVAARLPKGTCGYRGGPRASVSIALSSTVPVSYAIINVLDNDEIGQVFVIDDFYVSTGSMSAVAPTTPICSSWNLALELEALKFEGLNNQEGWFPDACGNLKVWHFMTMTTTATSGPYSPENFVPISTPFDSFEAITDTYGLKGNVSFSTLYIDDKVPFIAINLNDDIQEPYTIDWEPKQVNVHPGKNQLAIVGWKSPISGVISLTGAISDMDATVQEGTPPATAQNDPHSVDGVSFSIQIGSVELISIPTPFTDDVDEINFAELGSKRNLDNIQINEGDHIYFIVSPNIGFLNDSTGIEVEISVK